MNAEALQSNALELNMKLDELMLQRFSQFEEALYDWNSKMNLTRVPRDECWIRHFLDSLLVAEFCPHESNVLDIGTGPGFPAWPLALARPDLKVTAIDSSGKMLSFLATQNLPNLRIVQSRAEDWTERDAYDVVTGRALAPLAIQLELSAAFCKVGGACVPMRTESDLENCTSVETRHLGLELSKVETRILPVIGAPRLFPIFLKSKPTNPKFPRSWAEIKRPKSSTQKSRI